MHKKENHISCPHAICKANKKHNEEACVDAQKQY